MILSLPACSTDRAPAGPDYRRGRGRLPATRFWCTLPSITVGDSHGDAGQPPLCPAEQYHLERPYSHYSPMKLAIRSGLGRAAWRTRQAPTECCDVVSAGSGLALSSWAAMNSEVRIAKRAFEWSQQADRAGLAAASVR